MRLYDCLFINTLNVRGKVCKMGLFAIFLSNEEDNPTFNSDKDRKVLCEFSVSIACTLSNLLFDTLSITI